MVQGVRTLMPNIVVVGSVNMDLVVKTPRLPRLGETVMGEDMLTVGGGKGANQAMACARLGADVFFIASIGRDLFGERLLGTLEKEGIDCSGVKESDDTATGTALITVGGEGDNTIVVSPGANRLLCSTDLRSHPDMFAKSRTALFQMEIPTDTIEEGLILSKEHGLMTILDPAPFKVIPDFLLQYVDIVTPNSIELLQMAGTSDREAAAARLLEKGIGKVILTAGKEGAVLFDRDLGMQTIPAPSVTAIDSTGSGDAFTGGLAMALSENRDIVSSIKLGNCCGALACTVIGAQTSLPFRKDAEELYRRTYR